MDIFLAVKHLVGVHEHWTLCANGKIKMPKMINDCGYQNDIFRTAYSVQRTQTYSTYNRNSNASADNLMHAMRIVPTLNDIVRNEWERQSIKMNFMRIQAKCWMTVHCHMYPTFYVHRFQKRNCNVNRGCHLYYLQIAQFTIPTFDSIHYHWAKSKKKKMKKRWKKILVGYIRWNQYWMNECCLYDVRCTTRTTTGVIEADEKSTYATLLLTV